MIAGDEVVQFYIHDWLTEMVTRPVMELKAFRRITLQPGETRRWNSRSVSNSLPS